MLKINVVNVCVCVCVCVCQISMASLSLVEELLQKPHRDILDVLVLNYLQNRSYLCSPVGAAEERHLESSEANEDSE